MDPNLEIIYKAANPQQAAILKNVLSDVGIDSVVTNIALTGIAGEAPVGWSSAPCVMVRSTDLDAARAIAEQFDADISTAIGSEPDNEEEQDAAQENDPSSHDSTDQVQGFSMHHEHEPTWDPCPRCSSVRRGRCPQCDAFDAYFSPAEYVLTDRVEYQEADGIAESFEVDSPEDHFMCSICDTPVVPEPLRFCDRCQHDFGEGLEIEQLETEPVNARVWLTFAVLGILAVISLIYAWSITR